MKAWKPPQKNKNQNNKTSSKNKNITKNTTSKKQNNNSLNQPTPLIIKTQQTETKNNLIKKIGKIFIALLPIIIVLGLLYTVLFIFFPDTFAQIGEFGKNVGSKTKVICHHIYDQVQKFAENVLHLPKKLSEIFALIVPPLFLLALGLVCFMIPVPVVGQVIGVTLIAMGGIHFLVNLFSPPKDKTPPSNKIPPTEVRTIEKENETTKKPNPTERS